MAVYRHTSNKASARSCGRFFGFSSWLGSCKSKYRVARLRRDGIAVSEWVIIAKRGTPIAEPVLVASTEHDHFGLIAEGLKVAMDIGSPTVPPTSKFAFYVFRFLWQYRYS